MHAKLDFSSVKGNVIILLYKVQVIQKWEENQMGSIDTQHSLPPIL